MQRVSCRVEGASNRGHSVVCEVSRRGKGEHCRERRSNYSATIAKVESESQSFFDNMQYCTLYPEHLKGVWLPCDLQMFVMVSSTPQHVIKGKRITRREFQRSNLKQDINSLQLTMGTWQKYTWLNFHNINFIRSCQKIIINVSFRNWFLIFLFCESFST